MKIVTNEALIKRNQRTGQITSLAGLTVLGIGMVISFALPQYIWASIIALPVGFILSQIGLYYGNRFGRSPRPDEIITRALKGLDDRYTLMHYTAPTAHLLTGPAGVWVLLPKYQRGTITYDEKRKRWRQSKQGFFYAYLSLFGQEGLGRPDLDIQIESNAVQRYLTEKLGEDKVPTIQTALIFTNENAVLEADNAPIPTIPAPKTKDLLRKAAKTRTLAANKVDAVNQAIIGERELKIQTENEETDGTDPTTH